MSDGSRSSTLSTDDIRNLLELLSAHEVNEFKLERGGEKLWLKRGAPVHPIVHADGVLPLSASISQGASTPPPTTAPDAPVAASAAVVKMDNVFEARSPMVGTFYRKPAVDAAPYVEVGDIVKKGDPLCIVEAMKLMNEIESEVNGRIVQVCLQDGQMVEYGEVLFRIEPTL